MGNCFSDNSDGGHTYGQRRNTFSVPPHAERSLPPFPPSHNSSNSGSINKAPSKFEQHDLRRQRSADVLQETKESYKGHRRGSSYDDSPRSGSKSRGALPKSQSSLNLQDRRQASNPQLYNSAPKAGLSGSKNHSASHSVTDVSKPSNFKQGIHISVDEDGNLQVPSFSFGRFSCKLMEFIGRPRGVGQLGADWQWHGQQSDDYTYTKTHESKCGRVIHQLVETQSLFAEHATLSEQQSGQIGYRQTV